MQPQVILYIAASLDGYIAKKDDDLSWLSAVETRGEDYGYADFVQSVGTVIMGRKTYDKVLTFGIPFPHKGRKCYVLSRTKTGSDENVEFYNGNLADLINQLRNQNEKNIFIDGGAQTVLELMKLNLIDRYIVSIIPTLLGDGIRLFQPGSIEIPLKLTRSCTFPSGLVQLWYGKKTETDETTVK